MYEIARDSGLTRGALSRFMAGQRDMNLRTLQKIAPTIGLRLVVDPPKRFDRELTAERRKVR